MNPYKTKVPACVLLSTTCTVCYIFPGKVWYWIKFFIIVCYNKLVKVPLKLMHYRKILQVAMVLRHTLVQYFP